MTTFQKTDTLLLSVGVMTLVMKWPRAQTFSEESCAYSGDTLTSPSFNF